MRHERSIGLVFSEEHYGSVKRHLHYADPVLCFGEEKQRVGRGKPVLAIESPVGFASLMGMKIVWGSDVDAVCLELSKGHVFTVFVSNKSPSKKVKAALNKLGQKAREVIVPEGVGRIISLNGSCFVQKLVSDEWQVIPAQQTPKPKSKSKSKSKKSVKNAGEK